MRRNGVLCTLLLMVGASCAYPQYGAQQEPVVPEPAVPDPAVPDPAVPEPAVPEPAVPDPAVPDPAVPDPAVPDPQLTDQIKEALGEFWWQNQGVFDVEGNEGTGVVVQDPSSQPESQIPEQIASPFIPTPSPDCPHLHGCIPWQYCIDGTFTSTGEGLLALRTPTKVPETYTQKLCGQVGNICCGIPSEILEAQQQGQSEGTGPYGSSAGGVEIIEVVIPNDGIIAVVDQTGGGVAPGGAGPYVDGSDGGEIIEVISTGLDGTVVVVDQTDTSGGGVSVVPTVTVLDPTSGGDGYGGDTGSTDGETGIVGDTVAVIETIDTGCPAYTHDCVPYFQCVDGEINTSGAGLIDVRIKPQKECTNPAYPTVPGLCCKIPVDLLPSTTTPTPPPTPAPLQACPGTKVCVVQGQCNPDGTVNTDGTGLINTRFYSSCYLDYVDASNFVTGVCCEPPPPPRPTPLVTCPGNQVCLTQGFCALQGTGDYDPSAVVTCYFEGGSIEGECCNPPPTPAPTPPPTPAPVVTCPGTKECVERNLCNSDGTINTDGAGLINVRVYHKNCYLDAAAYTTGVCCQPPTPPPPVTPAPLQTCPGNQICLSQGDCASQSAATGGLATSYTSCVLDAATYATGVCCDSPIRVVDVCPGTSVCLPEILCQGEILNDADQYVQYGATETWTQCGLSGGLDTAGVCCRDLVTPAPTPSPLPVANKCGVRNYGLDLRISGKLEKNETEFGEFPWQAIIFFTNFTFKCGASVIDDRWLLTAAHCVNGYQYNDFRIRLGEWQVDKYDEPLPYVDAEIASIIIHPDFKPGPVHNDVALIELATPITPQYHINSVCLPNFNQIPAQGTRCFASGWGKDAFSGIYQPKLKKIDVPVVEKSYCQQLLRKTRLGKYFILDQSFMCAGGEENKDACEGDGGGPLVCEDLETGRYYVAGITAWGIDCGVKDIPGVYADVQLFRPWIDGIINPTELEEQQQQPSGYGRK